MSRDRDGHSRPTTIGIYVREDTDTVDRFDELLKRRTRGSYSRSEEIINAMEFYITAERLFERRGMDFASEMEKRTWVQQALRFADENPGVVMQWLQGE